MASEFHKGHELDCELIIWKSLDVLPDFHCSLMHKWNGASLQL